MSVPILISTPRAGGENYVWAVARAGGMPCPAYCPAYDGRFAGLVLCGGGDIHPALFGQQDAGSRDIDLHRDRAELALTAAFLRAGKPILGICRGHQVLNVALGGDWDGCAPLAGGITDVRSLEKLYDRLIQRNYGTSLLDGLFFNNLMRVVNEICTM